MEPYRCKLLKEVQQSISCS